MDQPVLQKSPKTFSDMLRVRFKGILDPIGAFLNKIGLTPNAMTLIGLAGHIGAAYLLARGEMLWGGVVVMVMGPFDALDGTMARLRGKTSRFGGFLDSVVDRYAELFLLGGLLIYYSNQQLWLPVVLVYAAAAGSVMVSYTRSRGETADFKVTAGLMTRVERYIVIVLSLLFNRPIIALWILAILGNLTALQRIWLVRKQAAAENDLI
ncbi:MAG TPA: CDP-alcohol phosphatidyltransferase family protein [Anaerolineaceae bacterium]|nr:CDP-alcohol phosphatidyltransferase family protein [Anaerolineaceae bacterium]